jgi:hypothetical protein
MGFRADCCSLGAETFHLRFASRSHFLSHILLSLELLAGILDLPGQLLGPTHRKKATFSMKGRHPANTATSPRHERPLIAAQSSSDATCPSMC